MISVLLRHRTRLRRLIVIAGIASVLVTVLAALVLRRGDWVAQRFLLVYVAPLFAFGAAWAYDRLARIDRDAPAALVLDAVAFAAGALRVAGGWGVLPYSGHMLFLSYAVATPAPWSLRLIALALIAMTSIFKLVLWHDARSWVIGLAVGLALSVVRSLVARRSSLLRRPREGADAARGE